MNLSHPPGRARRSPIAWATAVAVLVIGALGAAVPALAAGNGSTPPAASAPVQLTLPAPSGPYRVGTAALHLVDASRQDPWVPGQPRQLMISIWYPARDTARYPLAPWMPPGAFVHFEQTNGIPTDAVEVPTTAGHDDAPVLPRLGGWPVLLYSPGLGDDRTMNTTLVQDLASHGYVVVTLDHTYDAEEVEFPNGQILGPALPDDSLQTNTTEVTVRAADTRFVLDQLTAVDHGADPDAEHHPLPTGLADQLDLSKIGMFGHSMGGATAAAAMHDDPRITAGLDLDGSFYGPVADTGLTRPFMLVSSQDHNRDNDPSWAGFWSHLSAWRLDIKVQGAQHASFTDAEFLYPQLASTLRLTATQIAQVIGTIPADQARQITLAYVDAFFDRQLLHHDSPLLHAPSPRYPEVEFIP